MARPFSANCVPFPEWKLERVVVRVSFVVLGRATALQHAFRLHLMDEWCLATSTYMRPAAHAANPLDELITAVFR